MKQTNKQNKQNKQTQKQLEKNRLLILQITG